MARAGHLCAGPRGLGFAVERGVPSPGRVREQEP
jgi:hypothetical protein